MTDHEPSASAHVSASTLLPATNVVALPLVARKRALAGNFTRVSVLGMQCSAGENEKFFWDASLRGFGIRALRSGRRSWIFQYRDEHARTRRIVLEDVSAVG